MLSICNGVCNAAHNVCVLGLLLEQGKGLKAQGS